MDLKELVGLLNEKKVLRQKYKEIVLVLDKSIEILPFLSFKEKKIKEKTLVNIQENDICIYALMNMIEYVKGKKLGTKELKELEESIKVHLFHISMIEQILNILKAYNINVSIDFEEYIKMYYKKQIDLWKLYAGKKDQIARYMIAEENDLEYIRRKNKQITIKR